MRANTQILLASMFLDEETHFNNGELLAVPDHLLFISSSLFALGHFLLLYASGTGGIFQLHCEAIFAGISAKAANCKVSV